MTLSRPPVALLACGSWLVDQSVGNKRIITAMAITDGTQLNHNNLCLDLQRVSAPTAG